MPILECADVSKVFHTYRRAKGLRGIVKNLFDRDAVEVRALDHIDLRCDAGEMVGLIGSNGAGKTTLVKALVGIVPVTSGSATLFGQPSFHLTDAHKRRLSLVMGQRSQLWWDLPPMDSFELLREIYSIERARFRSRLEEYSEMLAVTDQLGIQLRQLSLGQRMKMEFIGAFLHDPEVVFLDEPTIGLDLVSRETVRSFLLAVNRARGMTVVLTSHDMEDIEETCKRLVILERGRKIFDGDLVHLQRRIVGMRAIELHFEPAGRAWQPEAEAELARLGAEVTRRVPLGVTLLVPADRTPAVLRRLYELVDVRDLAIERQPLEHLVKEIFAGRGGELGG